MASREEIEGYSAYILAEMAGVPAPDSVDSAGAVFLKDVRSFVFDAEAEQFRLRAGNSEGGVVTDRTYEVWQIFVDLAAFTVADGIADEEGVRPEMTTEGAQYVLGAIAERLSTALLDDEDEDEDDE